MSARTNALLQNGVSVANATRTFASRCVAAADAKAVSLIAAVGSACAVFAAGYEPELGWSQAADLPEGTGFVWAVAANDAGASWFLGSRGVTQDLSCKLDGSSFAHALAEGVTIELGEVPAASLEVASGGNALLAWQRGDSVYARWLSAVQ